MKKVLLSLAIIATLGAKAQSDTTGLATKIVDKFKAEYVKEHFKDPYSFQLLSIKYTAETNLVRLKTAILQDSLAQGYSFLSKKQRNERLSKMNSNIEILNNMSEAEKNTLLRYIVFIECRGANSYGGLVYSEKVGYYYPDTNTLSIL